MRQSNILITCFILFLAAFLGYSLWHTNETHPFTEVSREKQDTDMQRAEEFLHNADAERSLPIIHSYKEEMEKGTPEGKKWLNLFVEASAATNDADQLLMIYHFNPDLFKTNEKGALVLADGLLKSENDQEYEQVRKLWLGREHDQAAWTLLDADKLMQEGKNLEAYLLLKDYTWIGKQEKDRQLHIALIKLNDDPNEALLAVNAAYENDPKNTEANIIRGKIYESQGKQALAEKEYLAAVHAKPLNIYVNDQLAEYYRRQKNFSKALSIWQKLITQTANDHIWVKGLFWNQAALPTQFNWKNAHLTDDKSRQFLVYLLSLKPGEFWNQAAFEKMPYHLEALSEYQATYWLKLMQAFKKEDEQRAQTLLDNNPFAAVSWSPSLEMALHRILNYRKTGSLSVDWDQQHSQTFLALVPMQSKQTTLFTELELLAQQQADEGHSFKMPESMHALLKSPEVYSIAFLSEGWTEAALQMHNLGALSNGVPDWVAAISINAIRQNRGNQAALNFAEKQKQTPIVTLLTAETEIAEGKMDQALVELNKLSDSKDEIGARAVWLISLIDIQNKDYAKAAEAIESHPTLAESLQGQEILGRIAALQGNTEQAINIYKSIVQQSSEAKSFLARQAYLNKDWVNARQLTEALMKEYPDNGQLTDNLKKIIANSIAG